MEFLLGCILFLCLLSFLSVLNLRKEGAEKEISAVCGFTAIFPVRRRYTYMYRRLCHYPYRCQHPVST